MDRYRVAGERIDCEDVIVLRRFVLHGQPGVSQNDVHLGWAITQEKEVVARDADYHRVDFIEAEDIARVRVSRDGPGPEADHTDPARTGPAAFDRKTHSGLAAVISRRLAVHAGLHEFRPVEDGAVTELADGSE